MLGRMDAPAPPSPPGPDWRSSLRWRWRRLLRLPLSLMIATLLLSLGSVQAVYQMGNIAYRSWLWKGETAEVQTRVDRLESDVRVLKAAERAGNDPAYLETLARCQGFVRRGEKVIVATSAPAAPSEICAPVRLP